MSGICQDRPPFSDRNLDAGRVPAPFDAGSGPTPLDAGPGQALLDADSGPTPLDAGPGPALLDAGPGPALLDAGTGPALLDAGTGSTSLDAGPTTSPDAGPVPDAGGSGDSGDSGDSGGDAGVIQPVDAGLQCGNGVVQPLLGEQCEPATTAACDAQCLFEPTWAMTQLRQRVHLIATNPTQVAQGPTVVTLPLAALASLFAEPTFPFSSDIRVTDAAGILLPHEITDSDSDSARIFIRVPFLSTVPEDLYLYFQAQGGDPLPLIPTTEVWTEEDIVLHFNDVTDATANGYDGTFVGGSHLLGSSNLGQSLTLDGGGSYFALPPDIPLISASSACTIELWAKFSGPVSVPAVMAGVAVAGAPTFASRCSLAMYPSNQLLGVSRVNLAETPHTISQSLPNISIQNWHHYAGVFNYKDATAALYVDGEQVRLEDVNYAEPATAAGLSPTGSIGAEDNGAGKFMAGKIDEVHISALARSAVQIKSHYVMQSGAGVAAVSLEALPLEALP